MGKENKETFAKLLIAVGGILALVAGVLHMASFQLMAIVYGLIILLCGLAALLSAVKPGQPIPCNIVVELILGIVIIWLSWFSVLPFIGGLLIIVGGIFLAID